VLRVLTVEGVLFRNTFLHDFGNPPSPPLFLISFPSECSGDEIRTPFTPLSHPDKEYRFLASTLRGIEFSTERLFFFRPPSPLTIIVIPNPLKVVSFSSSLDALVFVKSRDIFSCGNPRNYGLTALFPHPTDVASQFAFSELSSLES